MKITVKVSHKVRFNVAYFEPTEGGMDTDTFGDTVSTLEEAIHLLEIALAQFPDNCWMITCDVQTQITK